MKCEQCGFEYSFATNNHQCGDGKAFVKAYEHVFKGHVELSLKRLAMYGLTLDENGKIVLMEEPNQLEGDKKEGT